MKSYEEFTESVLEKSGRAIRERTRRRRAAVSTLTASAAVAAVVLLCCPTVQTLPDGMETGQSSAVSEGQDTEQDTEQDADGGDADADPDIDADTDSESASGAVDACAEATDEKVSVRDIPGNVIVINDLSGTTTGSGQTSFPARHPDLYKEYGRDGLLEFYGLKELDISTVLEGFIEDTSLDELGHGYGVQFMTDGSELESHTFIWKNEATKGSFCVEFAHGHMPTTVSIYIKQDGTSLSFDDLESSTLNGVTAWIGTFKSYFDRNEEVPVSLVAVFKTDEIGALVDGTNLTEDEFLEALAYVISLCNE